jgi:hypothetical protein
MLRSFSLVACGLLLAVSSGCHSSRPQPRAAAPHPQSPPVKVAPPTPLDVKAEELGGPTWDKHWDIFIEKNLPAELLGRQVPRDVQRYCPAFYRMSEVDKRAWWAYFFQAVAAAEAGLKPQANVRHTEPEVAVLDKVTHRIAHQEGLLQLRYEDADRYGCNFSWEADKNLAAHAAAKTILNPENNLACGIRILDRQIIERHKPIYSRSSYWATLQPGTAGFRVFTRQMTNPPPACAAPHRLAPVAKVTAQPGVAQNQELAKELAKAKSAAQ